MRVPITSTCKRCPLDWLACALMPRARVPETELTGVCAAENEGRVVWMEKATEEIGSSVKTVLRSSLKMQIPYIQ